eukprot:Opistho-1_new@67640
MGSQVKLRSAGTFLPSQFFVATVFISLAACTLAGAILAGEGHTQAPTPAAPTPAEWTGAWYPTEYGTCSKPCGGGISLPTAYECRDAGGKRVNDEFCYGLERPARGIDCNDAPCAWVTLTYSPCSDPCNGGTSHPADVTCRTQGGETVGNEYCSGIDRPNDSRACNTLRCAWVLASASDCDGLCKTGTRRKTWTCSNPNNAGEPAPTSYCPIPAPATSEDCTLPSCTWKQAGYAACSAECNGGRQKPIYNCASWDGTRAAPKASCAGIPVPKTIPARNCSTLQCQWVVATTGPCNATCGPAVRNVTYACQNPNVSPAAPASSAALCQSPKPPTTVACKNAPCVNYSWVVTNYSACTKECNGGRQSPSKYACKSSNGATVALSFCSGLPKPTASVACDVLACAWAIATQGPCKKVGGQRVRKVTWKCTNPNSNNATASVDTLCKLPRPADTIPC